jgi:hypothetical protein
MMSCWVDVVVWDPTWCQQLQTASNYFLDLYLYSLLAPAMIFGQQQDANVVCPIHLYPIAFPTLTAGIQAYSYLATGRI